MPFVMLETRCDVGSMKFFPLESLQRPSVRLLPELKLKLKLWLTKTLYSSTAVTQANQDY
jgi:hypothetical protein